MPSAEVYSYNLAVVSAGVVEFYRHNKLFSTVHVENLKFGGFQKPFYQVFNFFSTIRQHYEEFIQIC